MVVLIDQQLHEETCSCTYSIQPQYRTIVKILPIKLLYQCDLQDEGSGVEQGNQTKTAQLKTLTDVLSTELIIYSPTGFKASGLVFVHKHRSFCITDTNMFILK